MGASDKILTAYEARFIMCSSAASTGLCGGRRVTAVPTATHFSFGRSLDNWEMGGTSPIAPPDYSFICFLRKS
jgi:hypothetical protein